MFIIVRYDFNWWGSIGKIKRGYSLSLKLSKWLVTARPYPSKHFEGDGCGLRLNYCGISCLTKCIIQWFSTGNSVLRMDRTVVSTDILCLHFESWNVGSKNILPIPVKLITKWCFENCEMGFCTAHRHLDHVSRLEGLNLSTEHWWAESDRPIQYAKFRALIDLFDDTVDIIFVLF